MSDEKIMSPVDLEKMFSEDEKKSPPKNKQSRQTSARNNRANNAAATRTQVQNVNGKQVVAIPWVHRVKVWVIRALMLLPLFSMYMMYVTYEAGELGYNTFTAGLLAFVAQGAAYVAIKFSNTQDIWNEIRPHQEEDV